MNGKKVGSSAPRLVLKDQTRSPGALTPSEYLTRIEGAYTVGRPSYRQNGKAWMDGGSKRPLPDLNPSKPRKAASPQQRFEDLLLRFLRVSSVELVPFSPSKLKQGKIRFEGSDQEFSYIIRSTAPPAKRNQELPRIPPIELRAFRRASSEVVELEWTLLGYRNYQGKISLWFRNCETWWLICLTPEE